MNTVMSGIILMALGAGAVAVGIYLFIHEKNKRKRCTAFVTGTVTEIETGRIDNGPENPVPVCKYTVDGHDYTLRASAGMADNLLKVGDTTEISYDPKDPSCAVFAIDKSRVFTGCIIAIVIGAVVLVTGTVLLV